MNIGIYGDSYACHNDWVYAENGIRKSWVDYIKDHHIVTNYSFSGSNLSYTHDKVCQYHNLHDVNIVLITNPGRLYLPNLEMVFKFTPGLHYVETELANITNKNDINILQAAKDYYIYIENRHEIEKFHYLMIENIRHTVPNSIIVPCFPISMGKTKVPSMLDISFIDNKYYGLDIFAEDIKRCHLSDKNNMIFGNKMLEYIENKRFGLFHIDANDYVEPIGEPIDYNFGKNQKQYYGD